MLKAAVVNASAAKFPDTILALISTPFSFSILFTKFSEKTIWRNFQTPDGALPILVSIACIISFNCFVEKPAERVDRRRFHLGMSEIKSSVSPKICPPPMLPPPGVRWGNEIKFEAKIRWIRFGSTLEWSQYRPRSTQDPWTRRSDPESSKGWHSHS